MYKSFYFFLGMICITACNSQENPSTNNFADHSPDSIEIVETAEEDRYDSVQGKWFGPHAARLNLEDTSAIILKNGESF